MKWGTRSNNGILGWIPPIVFLNLINKQVTMDFVGDNKGHQDPSFPSMFLFFKKVYLRKSQCENFSNLLKLIPIINFLGI
jgi:hypothetical protein